MVAEFMTEGRKKRPKRGDAVLDGGAHPNADELLIELVIPEQLRSPSAFADADRPRAQHANSRHRNAIELRRRSEEQNARLPNGRDRFGRERLLDAPRRRQQALIGRQRKTRHGVALLALRPKVKRLGNRVRDHTFYS
jgi:hypothetical protein